MSRYTALILTLAALTGCSTPCDGPVLITGVVVDRDGEPLAGSRVTAMTTDDYQQMRNSEDQAMTMTEDIDDSEAVEGTAADDDMEDVEEVVEPTRLEVEADDDGGFSFELDSADSWVLWAFWDDGRHNGYQCNGKNVELDDVCRADQVEIALNDCYELD